MLHLTTWGGLVILAKHKSLSGFIVFYKIQTYPWPITPKQVQALGTLTGTGLWIAMVSYSEGFVGNLWQWRNKMSTFSASGPRCARGQSRDIVSRSKAQCSLYALQQVETVIARLLKLLSNAKKHCFSGHEVQECADKNAIPWYFHLSYSRTAAGLSRRMSGLSKEKLIQTTCCLNLWTKRLD